MLVKQLARNRNLRVYYSILEMSETQTSTSADAGNQQAATFRRLHPKAYLERFIAEKFRPDGRELNEWRDISVNVGEGNAARHTIAQT